LIVTKVVLDASAVLALLNDEAGAEQVRPLLGSACMSAVNLSEAAGWLQTSGLPAAASEEALGALGIEIVPFESTAALVAAGLQTKTRAHGLSLGDRACLATAMQLGLPAVTADRQWLKLRLGVKVVGIR
jgi:PIN domain nuclease of toxin-antitoxin system